MHATNANDSIHHFHRDEVLVNRVADAADTVLRISMDAKARVKVGPFARGGQSRVPTIAADHDFHPDATVTPVGIFLPALDALLLYGITSQVTSDCLADCLRRWWEVVYDRFAHLTTLVIKQNLGNLRRNIYPVFRPTSLYLRCPLNVVIVLE